jgi:ABC-2 type transport system ATP-binding protein
MDYIIETHDLTRVYGNLIAVDKLNIQVEHGEVFGLLGPNGAGKTTTISMLSTILRPTSGSATVNGFDIVKQSAQVRKSIGIVFQEPSVDDRLTGRENMFMHANLYGVPKDVQKKRIEDLLVLVELDDRQNDALRTYSGGMRRRLEIARGLLHYPHVLFLDEPTIGLDPQTRELIWRYITALRKEQDITIILTTHYMEEADILCHRIAIIDFGKIVALDTPQNLKAQLEEDVVTIKTHHAEALLQQLEAASPPLINTGTIEGLEVKVKVINGSEVIPRIVELASNAGMPIEAISLHQPNLEDVFLHYTGRQIRDEKGEAYHGVAQAKRRAIK